MELVIVRSVHGLVKIKIQLELKTCERKIQENRTEFPFKANCDLFTVKLARGKPMSSEPRNGMARWLQRTTPGEIGAMEERRGGLRPRHSRADGCQVTGTDQN